MNTPRRVNKWVTLAIALIGVLVAWFSQRGSGPSPPNEVDHDVLKDNQDKREIKKTTFNFYLMALTAHTAFCADGNSRTWFRHRDSTLSRCWSIRDASLFEFSIAM